MDKMRDAIRNITTFHQRSKYAEEDDEEQTGGLRKKKKKRPFTLPHWTTYIAWASEYRSSWSSDDSDSDSDSDLLES